MIVFTEKKKNLLSIEKLKTPGKSKQCSSIQRLMMSFFFFFFGKSLYQKHHDSDMGKDRP